MPSDEGLRLPPVSSVDTIARRLPLIFPEGIEHRNYVIRDMAARTVFVMLYAGAIEGSERWIRPSQVTDMTDIQAAKISSEERDSWVKLTLSSSKKRPADAWYAPNSREPIRDETIRLGFIPTGAVIERQGLPTTSALPKYSLQAGFAALFDETLTDAEILQAIRTWQERHLSKSALARITLIRTGTAGARARIQVSFPNGEVHQLSAGPSSVIAKAVIEEFAPRFLKEPAVLWLSEPGSKVIARYEALASKLGLKIDSSKNLPDMILVDLGQQLSEVLILFVEIVATDGPINSLRQAALRAIALEAGFSPDQVAYLTAFEDRSASAYRKLASELAWGSFVWFMSEPQNLMVLLEGVEKTISQLR